MKKFLAATLLLCASVVSFAAAPPRYPVTEASVILPLTNSNGESLSAVHDELKQQLLAWQQFVATPVQYGQAAADGTVSVVDSIRYTVAMKCESAQQDKFRDVVRAARDAAGMEGIYLQQCSSHVMVLK